MRLLNVSTFKLEEFYDDIPEYAILSHTWGEGEVLYQNLSESGRMMKGWSKIENCCSKAAEDGWEYVWIDTCCIDNTSSAQLSEAINSMYTWYQKSSICYAYLSDVRLQSANSKDQFRNSRWFTRGWTLQELIAPKCLIFFDDVWTEIGTKDSLSRKIVKITKIPQRHLNGSFGGCCIAEKMSWAAFRITSRTEDMAYCLMGLLGINMPLLYGEGVKSFIRLQHELIRSYDDDSLFAWQGNDQQNRSLFATSPQVFAHTGFIYLQDSQFNKARQHQMFSMTNKGLRFTTPLYRRDDKETAYFLPLCSSDSISGNFLMEVVPVSKVNQKYFHRKGSKLLKIKGKDELQNGWTQMPEREIIFKEPEDWYLPNFDLRHVLVFRFPRTFCDFSWKKLTMSGRENVDSESRKGEFGTLDSLQKLLAPDELYYEQGERVTAELSFIKSYFPPVTLCDFFWMKHTRWGWENVSSESRKSKFDTSDSFQKLLAPNELYYEQGETVTAELSFIKSYFPPVKLRIIMVWSAPDPCPRIIIRSLGQTKFSLGDRLCDMDFLSLMNSKDSRVDGIIKVAIRPRRLEERFQGMNISGQSAVVVTYASSEQDSDWPLKERIGKLKQYWMPLTLDQEEIEEMWSILRCEEVD